MKAYTLKELIFMALCCGLGLFSKRLIAPAANLLTDFLRIPGGIGTGFSLMFLIVAAALVGRGACALLMSLTQSLLALFMGMSGSMGLLAPLGYIIPGMVIDAGLLLARKAGADRDLAVLTVSVLGSVSAALTANLLVFRLRGVVLLLYAFVAATTGGICGLLAQILIRRLEPAFQEERQRS